MASARDTSLMPDGTAMEHCSMSIISKEFESFLGQKKENTKMLVFLTDIFDAPDRWEYRTKNSGDDETVAAYVNLLAATTPDSIASSLPVQAIGGGLTSRIMFVWSPGGHKKITAPPVPDPGLREALIQDLATISRIVGGYVLSSDCYTKWDRWYQSYDEGAADRLATDKAFKGWYARKPLYLQKLALIHTAAINNGNIIEWRAFERALEDVIQVEGNMSRTFTAVGRSDVSPDVDAVMREIEVRKVISERKLLQIVWRDIDSKKFDNVIETIIRTGKVRRQFKGPNGERGVWYWWAEGEVTTPNRTEI